MPLINLLTCSPPSLAIWTWFFLLWIRSTAVTTHTKFQWKTTGYTKPLATPKFTIYIHQRIISFSQSASYIKSSNSAEYLFRLLSTYWEKEKLIFDGFRVAWKFRAFSVFKTRNLVTHTHKQYTKAIFHNRAFEEKRKIIFYGSTSNGGMVLDFIFQLWSNHNHAFRSQIRMEGSKLRQKQSAGTSNSRPSRGNWVFCFISTCWETWHKFLPFRHSFHNHKFSNFIRTKLSRIRQKPSEETTYIKTL